MPRRNSAGHHSARFAVARINAVLQAAVSTKTMFLARSGFRGPDRRSGSVANLRHLIEIAV